MSNSLNPSRNQTCWDVFYDLLGCASHQSIRTKVKWISLLNVVSYKCVDIYTVDFQYLSSILGRSKTSANILRICCQPLDLPPRMPQKSGREARFFWGMPAMRCHDGHESCPLDARDYADETYCIRLDLVDK